MPQASRPHVGHQDHRACERAFHTSGWRSSAPSFRTSNDVTYSLPRYVSSLVLAIFLAFLAGCASGPPIYKESEAIKASFESLQTADPEMQASRFGVYAKVADRSFVGTMPDGRLAAYSYRWAIPGVVLEEKSELPWAVRLAFQYNPESRKLDVFNMLEAYTVHIRELTVLPDGSVEWPSALLGLEPPSRVTLGENGELDRTSHSGKLAISLREVSGDEYRSTIVEARARRNAEARAKSRSRSEFWNAVSQGLGQASAEIRAENDARQLREAERQSEIMRSKDAEMRASSRRLAEQQREAEAKERQQAVQTAREKGAAGYITVDDGESDRKFREEMAQRKRDADAQDAAMRQRKAELQAESDAKSAAREAEAMKRIKESEAKDRARLARCAAKGISARQCPTSASVQ